MDTYHPGTVYSSIDQMGRYAYGNQPRIAQWNLARLAETLLPLFADDQEAGIKHAQAAIEGFGPAFEQAYTEGLRRKLGLLHSKADDLALAQDLLTRMAEQSADFTLTFRALCDAAVSADSDHAVRALFKDGGAYDEWAVKWRARLAEDSGDPNERRSVMGAVNPRFIPRNHLVEEAIAAGVRGDFGPFETLVAVLSAPYDDQPEFARYADPPRPEQVVHQTFCGT
jgi:serine/tyrosine/threonine adenylyltransferase